MKKPIKTTCQNGHIPNRTEMLEHKLGAIEYRAVSALAAYSSNPRKHSDKQIVKLMASISQFGFVAPVLVDENGVIIAGEARVEAARRLGMKEVPVIMASHLSPGQVRAYRLADNRLAELGSWDDALLAFEIDAIIEIDDIPIEILGWETAEIDVIMDGAHADGTSSDPADDIPELPVQPVARAGDLWLLGKHRLFCGSSLEEASWDRVMDGKTAAMVFADMPFNVPVSGHVSGLGKVKHAEFAMASGEMDKATFIRFMTDGIARMAAAIKDGGVLTLAMDWRHSGEILAAMEANGLTLLNMCVWKKSNGGMGSLYRSQHELFWIAKKGKASHTNNVQLGKYGRYRTNCWEFAGANSFGVTRNADLADHPTVKPVALVAEAIRDVTHPGEIVIDGFMGSGSTICAAQRTRRIAFGVEIEPGYIDVAIKRWQAMTGEEAVLEETGETFAEVAARRDQEPGEPDDRAPSPDAD